MIAVGVDTNGYRQVLGTSVKLSENEVHWGDFLAELKDRGLYGVHLFISDAHKGLKAPRAAIFPTVLWQGGHFHVHQNAGEYVPRQEIRKEVAERIRAIFTAPNDTDAKRLWERFLEDYRKQSPVLVDWAEPAIPEGLALFTTPAHHRKKVRTVHVLEAVE
ncbi:MAG: hypothetical protein CSA33_01700 [Desulfobulbus propionicus]|nr:MAG: hypothetical protein CSA33_01700 [Desulfobulbus propionicus]